MAELFKRRAYRDVTADSAEGTSAASCHRETYYSLKYVDYERHSPERIDFVPPVSQREDWSRDYDNMLLSFIYGEAPDFTTLLKRMEELRERFRKI